MFKFVKWIAIGAISVAAGGYLLFGSHVGSYIGTAAGQIRQGISESIPVEFELKRAENLIREIEPQLHEAKREVAQAEVDLENVRDDVDRLESEVDLGQRRLKTVSSALGGQAAGVQLASYDRTRVQLDLERSFDAYKNHVALLKGKRALIERQERAVAAARMRLDAVRAEKARLEDLVAALKTQKRQLDALAASSKSFELDDTALGRAREVLEEIKNRLDVAQRMLEDEVFAGEVTGATSDRDIVREIQTYFEGGAEVGSVDLDAR
jgi:DNA repair exonuclease SbcCD ATPase subunit